MVVHIASTGLQIDAAIDLRRKRTRDLAETVADNAQWASPDDRAIIQAIYRDGLTAQQVAHLRNESPRRLRARVRRIVARLVSERFRFVLRSRDQWPPMRRKVAGACILQGLSMREAARFLQLTLHQVRREMDIIHALMAEESPQSRPPSRPTPPSGAPRMSGGPPAPRPVARPLAPLARLAS